MAGGVFMKKLLTAQELAKLLNVSVETVWRYTRQKKIPVVELGEKQYRYQEEAVLAALAGDASCIREENPAPRQPGKYTYRDYVNLPWEPGLRLEVLEGCLIREPSPSVKHQWVLSRLYRQLAVFFDAFDPEGLLFMAPLDVTLGEQTVVQPDLVFISGGRRDIVQEERIDGPCDLAVEVMSPANRRKDRLQKMAIYCRAGIPHYWLADPEAETLEAFSLREGFYALVAAGSPGEAFCHPDFPGLELNLERVFQMP
jgi:excisionase family DNA binding protein